ncbi:hypothetical protein RCL_jg1839.t1 [Rhizophagus clarus]|uniref:Uncharacterized protein n=1 Tax=Rhizophagus clarus TaxID=94130 RepID=A0A8H3L7X2_9GLOM|nr:hypothetical protein RCL_jg1839.t1 [Rhizophagus clarus]
MLTYRKEDASLVIFNTINTISEEKEMKEIFDRDKPTENYYYLLIGPQGVGKTALITLTTTMYFESSDEFSFIEGLFSWL